MKHETVCHHLSYWHRCLKFFDSASKLIFFLIVSCLSCSTRMSRRVYLCVEVIHCYVQAGFLQFVIIILFVTDYCTFLFFFSFFSFLSLSLDILSLITYSYYGRPALMSDCFFGSPPVHYLVLYDNILFVFLANKYSLALLSFLLICKHYSMLHTSPFCLVVRCPFSFALWLCATSNLIIIIIMCMCVIGEDLWGERIVWSDIGWHCIGHLGAESGPGEVAINAHLWRYRFWGRTWCVKHFKTSLKHLGTHSRNPVGFIW